ncbi:amidase domain-containing protein [Cytobacillus pseudoceanisediminis]|uniref:amidase domain-containing protein n=1 Tax=Cytobacillus pseudoceanisediminis TaxID=3051614 RepID=UPI003C2FFB16
MMVKKLLFKSVLVSAVTILGLSVSTGYTQVKAEGITGLKVEENVKKVEKVKNLKTVSGMSNSQKDAKKNGEKKYKKAMEIAEKFFAEKGIIVSNNLDDKDYQEAILSLGGNIESFKENEKKDILDFVVFMDFYENYETNERIDELKESFNNGVIEEEELEELLSYAPADEQITSETSSEPEGLISPMAVYANGYNNIAARDYAYKWTSNSSTLRNNSQYPYYSNQNNGCYSCWNDCTNFVSQAIRAGGMKFRGTTNWLSNSNWWYNNAKPSNTWGGAHNFYNHWKSRAGIASSVSALQTGDVVNADFGGDGHIDHTAIITRNTGSASSNKYLTQHTSDKEELTTLANWYNSGYKVYGYEMDKANN